MYTLNNQVLENLNRYGYGVVVVVDPSPAPQPPLGPHCGLRIFFEIFFRIRSLSSLRHSFKTNAKGTLKQQQVCIRHIRKQKNFTLSLPFVLWLLVATQAGFFSYSFSKIVSVAKAPLFIYFSPTTRFLSEKRGVISLML